MYISNVKDDDKIPRYALQDIEDFIKSKSKNIFELYGQRRVGKTTLLNQINSKYGEKSIMIVIENNDTMDELYELIDKNKDKEIIIIDEITKAEDFIFKSSKLYDYYSRELNKKIIISGTDSLCIDYSNNTELSGRYTKKQIYPMPLNEYIDVKCEGEFNSKNLDEYFKMCGYFKEYPSNQPIKDIVNNITNSFEKYNYYTQKITNQRDSFELIIFKMLLTIRWEFLKTRFPGLKMNENNKIKIESLLNISNKEMVSDIMLIEYITESLVNMGIVFKIPDIKMKKSENIIMNLKVKSLIDKILLNDEEYKNMYFKGEFFEDIMVYSSIVNFENELYSLDWDNEIEFDLVLKENNKIKLIDFKSNFEIDKIHNNKYFKSNKISEILGKDVEFEYVYNGKSTKEYKNSYEFLQNIRKNKLEFSIGDVKWI